MGGHVLALMMVARVVMGVLMVRVVRITQHFVVAWLVHHFGVMGVTDHLVVGAAMEVCLVVVQVCVVGIVVSMRCQHLVINVVHAHCLRLFSCCFCLFTRS